MRRAAWSAAALAVVLLGACVLNPQPEVPSDNAGSGGGGGFAGSGSGGSDVFMDASGDAMQATEAGSDVEVDEDATPNDGGLDAADGDADDAGDAGPDAESDALLSAD
ncbi:MAG: hypothetical protein R3B13_19450 [Polyangiaceae bacterium]